MAAEPTTPHSLNDQSADRIRNERRRGANAPVDPNRNNGPEANATMRQVWSQPGGGTHALRNAHAFRNVMVGAGTKADDHGELTAAETTETTRHLSDANLGPDDRDATAEAIQRATAVQGDDKAKG